MVLLTIGGLGPGGAERQLCNTAVGLARQPDFSVDVRTMYPLSGSGGFFEEDLRKSGVVPERLRAPDLKSLRRVPPELRGTALGYHIAAFLREIDASRPDVLHAWLDQTCIAAGIAACMAGVPLVVLSGRNVNPTHWPSSEPYLPSGYEWLIKRPEVVLVNNSVAGAADYADWLGLEQDQIHVIRNGYRWDHVDAEFGERDLEGKRHVGNEKVVMGVFRLYPEKQPLLWLTSAARVCAARDDVRFVLVGDGPLKGQCEDFIRDNDLAGRVAMRDTQRDVYRVMRESDLLLLTSQYEGLPNVLIEAQYLGVPVITTDAGGAAETVLNGRTGWVLGDASPDAVASQVERSLDDDDWRRRARLEAHARAKSQFGLDRMVSETLQLYAEGRPSPADE